MSRSTASRTPRSSSTTPTATRKSSALRRFFDGSEKYIYPNEEEFTFYQDGTVLMLNKDKVKVLQFPDDSLEVTFPDGKTIKMNCEGEVEVLAD